MPKIKFTNEKLTFYWFSFLFILIFLPLDTIANQTNLINNKQLEIKIRKQRNSFIKNELNHQNLHHFHNNKYYSSIPINYRSSDATSIYLNNEEIQSDAYIPYRSLHNHSILTASLGSSSFLNSASLIQQQQQTNLRNKLTHQTSSTSYSVQGPIFQSDLPSKISFSNNSGLILNCAASGQPIPIISWQTETGIIISSSQSIQDSYSNENLKYSTKTSPLVYQNPQTNALVFRSFVSDEFSPEVHSTRYRCLASNIHGTITSPLIQIKAVIKQQFQIEVPDEYVILKSTAIFRCQMPNQLKEYLQVLSWIEEPGSRSYPVPSHSYNQFGSFSIPSTHLETIINGSQYLTLPTGELYINQVDFTTAKKRFRCKVKNKLTGETITSVTAGKLIITEAHSVSQLRITDYRDKVNARLNFQQQTLNEDLDQQRLHQLRSQNDLNLLMKNDEYAILVCAAQSQPSPTYTWYREANGQRTPVTSILNLNNKHHSNNLKQFNNSIDNSLNKQTDLSFNLETNRAQIQLFKYIQWEGILFIRNLNLRDDGIYTCVINNTYDEERLDTRLSIQVPLSIKLTPTKENIETGRSNQIFNCTVIGHPQPEISFYFNGKKQPNQSAQQLLSKYSTTFQLPDQSPNLYWNEHLQLQRVNKDMKGMYQCIASNQFDQVQATAQLSLGTDPPVFHELFQSQVLDPGPSLSIKCSASGQPIPQITWSLDDGQPIPESNRVRYGDYVTKDSITISYVNISELRVEDGGIYRCTADNNFAKVQYERSIQIRGDPIVRPMQNVTVIQGETFIKNCPVAGYPIDSITWFFGDQKLPFNHRQKVTNGTLEILQIEKGTDEGGYTCRAEVYGKNARSKKAQSTFWLNVTVKPTIEPFEFAKNIREGQRASVTCTVSSGDLPISINWFHQGEPIEKLNKTVLTKSMSAYSSTLLFNSLSLHHKGNYTCVAENNAGLVSHSAIMQVNVQPRWSIEPSSEYSVVRGKSLSVDCQAEGYPLPNHRWTKADGNSIKDFKPIVSNPHLQVYENGSLTFVDARDIDSSYYLCTASNNIGPGLSKVVKININVAAHFKTKFSVETKQKGDQVRLKCETFADKPVKISWLKDKQRIEMKNLPIDSSRQTTISNQAYTDQNIQSLNSEPILQDSSRYEITDKLTDNGLISYLDILKTERKDSGLWTCFAYNQYGHDDTNIQLIIQEKPDAPQDIQIIEINSKSIKIAWTQPFNGNLPITSYLIQYSDVQSNLNNNELKSVYNLTIKNNECLALLTQLKPAHTYYIRLFAENRLGTSDASNIIDVITDEDIPSSPPTKLKTVVLSSKQVKVSWKSPDQSSLNGQLKGFYVGFRPLNSNDNKEQFVYKTIDINSKNNEQTFTTTLGNLRKNQKYSIIVQAYNNKGTGPSSEELVVQTLLFDVPDTPQLNVVSTTTSTIHIQWQPSHDENPIDGYLLYQREENQLEWKEYSLDATQTFYTTLGLKCGTRYNFYLIAYNKQGRGEQSETITVKTEGGLPIPPDRNSLLNVNTSSVSIKLDSWHHNGCPIVGFRIRYKLHGTKEWIPVNTDLNVYKHIHDPNQQQQDNSQTSNLQTMDINTSNAQQLSTNSISLLGSNSYYPMNSRQETSPLLNSMNSIPSVVNINDLQPNKKYILQISASNQVGSTDAEYNINTYSMISNELMRSSNRLLQHGQQLSAQLSDYTYLLPICLSLMIVIVLFIMVCVVVKRNNNQVPSNASTSLLYGSIIGNRKEEQLQMSNFNTLSGKQQQGKQINCDSTINNQCDQMSHLLITANGTICETMPKSNQHNHLNGQHTNGLEPLYATVKRTPRIRNAADPHIYSYPVQSLNGNLTSTINTLNSMSTNMNNGLNSCNTYSTNTVYNTCNGNGCNLNNQEICVPVMNCNQLDNSCNLINNQCLNETANKLMNCSSNDYNLTSNNSSSCNTSLNSGQLLSNNLNNLNNLNNKLICAEHDQLIENDKFLELNLCQIINKNNF